MRAWMVGLAWLGWSVEVRFAVCLFEESVTDWRKRGRDYIGSIYWSVGWERCWRVGMDRYDDNYLQSSPGWLVKDFGACVTDWQAQTELSIRFAKNENGENVVLSK
ncbi:hypothetical protein GGR50DRAFT_585113 [Xylaria sp. CBS 124048]|nr:hypothetical protein GGR50DRAFT_585113 [Xylaria sp. CBS 124048]